MLDFQGLSGRRLMAVAGIAAALVWAVFGVLILSSSSSAPPEETLITFPTNQIQSPSPTDDSTGTAPTAEVDQSTPTPVLAFIPEGGPQLNVDYDPMTRQINALIREKSYDVGAAFVDTVTGQVITFGRGEGRFHAMSTFKGALAAYYLWLLDHKQIEETEQDEFHIRQMLDWSSNFDTTCVFEDVGGIAGFNDWIADQGMPRKDNWVFGWESWPCSDEGVYYVPEYDTRYRDGDTALGLPGGRALMVCPDRAIPCDKSMQPVALAIFYANLMRGNVLTPPSLTRWLSWMEKPLPITSIFDALPPEDESVLHAYTKNGRNLANDEYDLNIYHDAGILVTPQGTFVLAVFMQGNPEFYGTDIHGQIGRTVYDAFVAAHSSNH